MLSETRQSYAAVQASDALRVILEDRRRILDRLLELARARLNAGEGTQLDVTTIETQRVEIEAEIADKELERQDARLKLARLLGEPSSDASWALTKWEAPTAATLTERQWVELSLRHRPEVTSKEYELRALGAERGLTRFAPLDRIEIGVASERDDGWSVGPSLAIPLPIFDTGQAVRAKADAAVFEGRHNLQQAQREAIEETRRAFASYRGMKENLARIERELLPLQERRLSQAEAQYKAGQADITSLFLAEQDLRSARTRQVELQQKTTQALIRLERAAGGPGVAGRAEATTAPARGRDQAK